MVLYWMAVAWSFVGSGSLVVSVEAESEQSLVVPAWGLYGSDRLSSSMGESEAAQRCAVVPLAAAHL